MKNRCLSLLLALLMLCTLVSCGEEPGAFYTDDSGRMRNDLITVEVTNESLVSPVTKISFNIYNASSCQQSGVNIFADLEMKKDGEWVKAPGQEEIFRIHRDIWAYGGPLDVVEKEVKLGSEEDYFALEAGEYRLIVSLDLLSPEGQITVYPTVEFTVTAPAQ